jgi:hypothetical protein
MRYPLLIEIAVDIRLTAGRDKTQEERDTGSGVLHQF